MRTLADHIITPPVPNLQRVQVAHNSVSSVSDDQRLISRLSRDVYRATAFASFLLVGFLEIGQEM